MTIHVRSCSDVASQPEGEPADCFAEQVAKARYFRNLDELMSDAVDNQRLDILADALAWTIARIAYGCGPAATGDVLRRIGAHLCTLETLRQTEAEAQRALREGHLPS